MHSRPAHTIKIALFLLLFFMGAVSYAQDEDSEDHKKNFHRVTIVLGHTMVPSGISVEGNRKWLSLPSWGLDYDYWLNETWALGVHSDIVVENFNVEVVDKANKDELLGRTKPLSVVASGIYKPIEHLSILSGLGGEFAHEENLLLIRLGLDMGWEINPKYEVSVSVLGDFKLEAYNSFTIGIGISRIFR